MSEYQYYEFQAINARDAMPEGGKVTIETSNAHLDRNYAAQHHDVPAGQYAPAPTPCLRSAMSTRCR